MSNLRFTFKTWPVVTLMTIGLCFLTQVVALLFGIELPDQANLDLVRKAIGWNRAFVLLIVQILVIMPAIEECLFRLPTRWLRNRAWWVVSAVLFSAAHYIFQPWPDSAFVALAFFGFAQCWLYRKTGRLWCAMLNHALFNLTNFVLLFFVK